MTANAHPMQGKAIKNMGLAGSVDTCIGVTRQGFAAFWFFANGIWRIDAQILQFLARCSQVRRRL
jgi:hypothetical protein